MVVEHGELFGDSQAQQACDVLSIGSSRARKTSARHHNGIMRDSFRIERDTMGDMQVPASALYGPQTARAVQNFPISGKRFPRSFVRALGMIKSAAAKMNGRMGHLPAALAESIEAAAEQVVEGRYDGARLTTACPSRDRAAQGDEDRPPRRFRLDAFAPRALPVAESAFDVGEARRAIARWRSSRAYGAPAGQPRASRSGRRRNRLPRNATESTVAPRGREPRAAPVRRLPLDEADGGLQERSLLSGTLFLQVV